MDNGTEQYFDSQPLYMDDPGIYAADQAVYNADIPVYNADIPMYNADVPMYSADQPAYNPERTYGSSDGQEELPPEPEDSPYEDPVVRHILSLRDDKYRTRMLRYLNEKTKPVNDLHPAIVLMALLVFFPAGLCMMYFGTRWGALAKTVITVFVLLMALAIYEILVLGDVLPTPSLIGTVVYLFQQLTGGGAAEAA